MLHADEEELVSPVFANCPDHASALARPPQFSILFSGFPKMLLRSNSDDWFRSSQLFEDFKEFVG